MAMGLAKSAGGGRRRGRRGHGGAPVISEINVTPMVDVMLVLLIVFMVAAPLLTVGVPIDLPKTAASAMQPDKKPVMVTVDSAGTIFVGADEIEAEALLASIGTLTNSDLNERIYVRGDTTADYGSVMKVMGALSGAGYTRIGLITQPEQER